MEYQPIGVIHSPFTSPEGMPIQPTGAKGIKGTVEVFEAFRPGLDDLDGFSHIILIYHLHRVRGYDLHVVPFLDSRTRGVFSTRAPRRPNPIGLSVIRLDAIEDGRLYVENVDILDKTPVLDIKPYIPQFDPPDKIETGWMAKTEQSISQKRSDDRFQ